MKHTTLRIAFTGGGTGGHVQPIVSLIEHGQKDTEIQRKCKLYRFGEKDSLESAACAELEGVQFVPVQAGKLRRYRDLRSTFQNGRDMLKVFGAVLQSAWLLSKRKIDVVFCKGGYVALPVCIAAWILRKKIVLHESDMHPGLTNRLVAKIVQTKFVGFPDTFPEEKVVGQILSAHLGQVHEEISQNSKTQVLVMGGSQGSHAILSALSKYLSTCPPEQADFTIILGTKNVSWRKKLETYENVILYDRVDQQQLAKIYAETDIAITRAGVTSLAEQQLFGIKKIIIPHPHGGGYHQLYNALWYSEAHEDIVVEEDEQLQENLQVFLKKLLGWKKERDGVDEEGVEKVKEIIWGSLVV